MVDRRGWLSAVAFLALCSVWAAGPAAGQGTGGSAGDVGLLGMIPAEATFFVERRGHEAVKEAFAASNFGKMAADDAINQFAHDSRVRIGQVIVRQLFDFGKEDADKIDRNQKLLHEVFKAVWYRPSAMFVLFGDTFTSGAPPGIGVLCLAGDYRKPAAEAMAALMASCQAGNTRWHAFTYRSGTLTWKGMLKGSPEADPPTDNVKLRKVLLAARDVVMFASHGQLLCAATNVRTADAIAKTVATPGKGKDTDAAVRGVLRKTAIRDWAFRWHVDIAGIFAMVRNLTDSHMELPGIIRMLAIDNIRGAGGAGGYADNVYTRRSYIDAPQDKEGLTRLFKRGGSYKKALAMTPGDCVVTLGGQLDKKVLRQGFRLWLSQNARAAKGRHPPPPPVEGGDAPPRAEGATKDAETGDTPPAVDEKLAKYVDDFLNATDGHATLYMTDLQSMAMGMSGRAGLPFGAVLSVKQPKEARKAFDALFDAIAGDDDAEGKIPKPTKVYRKIPIRSLDWGPALRVAWLDDRVVLAMGDAALKVGIDAALDDVGGLEPDSPAAKLMELAGEGSGFFTMDLAGMARLLWPMLAQAADSDDEDFPLTSLPSTQKMVRMLGREVAVIKPDAGGVLLSSRGRIPFATKLMFLALDLFH